MYIHKQYITWYELNVLQRSMDFNAFETHFDSWYGTHKGPMNYDSSSIWMDWFGCLKLSHAQTIRSSLNAGPEEVGRVMGARALPDITSGLEVRQIFKIWIVWKPDIFLPGRWTFNTFKNRKKKIQFLFSILIFRFF